MSLRSEERNSIHAFLEACGDAGLFTGKRVLDYGCGQQPYRELIKSFGGKYEGYDDPSFPANVSVKPIGSYPQLGDWRDTLVCTQVIQYVRYPETLLRTTFKHLIRPGGHLVMTYPTHWPEVEMEDLWRFTKAGMEFLLTTTGFDIVEHVPRHATYLLGGEALVHGYGVAARRVD